jgi:flagellar biosynthesis/type III secretory pathway protein FliH
MENKNKNYSNFIGGNSKPLVMLEFMTENDGVAFTYEDTKNAESEGYTKGFNEGIELGISQGKLKATREIDVIVQEILSKVDLSLKEITELEKAFLENFFPSIVRVCFIVLQKSMPVFFKKHGKKEMESLLKDVIKSLIVRVPIQVKISEYLYEDVLERLQNLCSAYPETIDIIKVPEFTDSACEIEWEGGGAKWNLDTRYQEIESKLQEYLKTDATQGECHG